MISKWDLNNIIGSINISIEYLRKIELYNRPKPFAPDLSFKNTPVITHKEDIDRTIEELIQEVKSIEKRLNIIHNILQDIGDLHD